MSRESFVEEVDYIINPNSNVNIVSNPKNINLKEFVEFKLNPYNVNQSSKHRLLNLDNYSFDKAQFLISDLANLNRILSKNIKQANKIKKNLQSKYGPLYNVRNIKERRFKTKFEGYDLNIYNKYVFVIPLYISYIEKLKYTSLVVNTLISILKNKNITKIISNNKFNDEDIKFLRNDVLNLLSEEYYENYVENVLGFIRFQKYVGISRG